MMLYTWLAILVLSVLGEAVTPALVAIWFMPASLAALILALCKVHPAVQVGVFVLVSLLLLIFIKPIVKRMMRKVRVERTNADALIGETAVVTEEIDNLAGTGLVKIRSQLWSARAATEGETFAVGDLVTVQEIQGVKLICIRKG